MGSLFVFCLIKTQEIKIFYSIFAFFLIFCILSLILKLEIAKQVKITFETKHLFSKRIVFYFLGGLAGVSVLVFPSSNLLINPSSIWYSFATLPFSSFVRVISAFFLTGIFPGVFTYFWFKNKYHFNLVEKIGIILLISYCFTSVCGLILIYLNIFSNFALVIVTFVFCAILETYRLLKFRDVGATKSKDIESTRSSFLDWSLIALIVAAIALVALSYIEVLSASPLSGIVSGDVADYMTYATRFFSTTVNKWSPYTLSNMFFWINSYLAGIPMEYAYAGLQFFQLIFISSFYFFVRSLFPENRKIAGLATLLCFFVAGLGSWLMMGTMVTSPNRFVDYMGANTSQILNINFNYTGAAGITPFFLSAFTFDFALVFYGLAFVYKSFFLKKRDFIDYLLPAFFGAAAIATHNINIVLILIFSLLIFGFFCRSERKFTLKTILLMVGIFFVLDALSKWQFISMFLSRKIFGTNLFYSILFICISLSIILFLIRKKDFGPSLDKIKGKIVEEKSKILFYLLSISFFILTLVFFFSDYKNISYTELWVSPLAALPWYHTLFRSYGILSLFALASIPILFEAHKKVIAFFIVFAASIAIPIVLSLVFPAVLSPSIVYTRYFIYLVIPISILAALGLTRIGNLFKKRALRLAVFPVLVFLICSSLLSQAYVAEYFYINGQSRISDKTASAIEWINANIPETLLFFL